MGAGHYESEYSEEALRTPPLTGPPKPLEIKFTYTAYEGIFECGRCGGAVINTEVHRSHHLTGR